MKQRALPDYRKKQHLLYTGKTSESELIALGDEFLNAGRLSDAVEFYQKADHRAGLETIKKSAKKMGDAMLLQQACKALNRTPSEEDWRLTAENAKGLKKYCFAIHAFEKSGDDDLLHEIRELTGRGGE